MQAKVPDGALEKIKSCRCKMTQNGDIHVKR